MSDTKTEGGCVEGGAPAGSGFSAERGLILFVLARSEVAEDGHDAVQATPWLPDPPVPLPVLSLALSLSARQDFRAPLKTSSLCLMLFPRMFANRLELP